MQGVRAALFERSEFAARPEHAFSLTNRNGVWHGATRPVHRLTGWPIVESRKLSQLFCRQNISGRHRAGIAHHRMLSNQLSCMME